jgi:thiosulfate dehydrogenase [quinone] large subunit
MMPLKTSFLLGRLAVGTSLFGHGLVRLPKLDTFSHKMAGQFQHSILPEALVLPVAYMLPVAEFLIGLLLIVGLFTRQALIAGAIVMILLIFGSTTIENWDPIALQLMHILFLMGLLALARQYDSYSLDLALRRKKA